MSQSVSSSWPGLSLGAAPIDRVAVRVMKPGHKDDAPPEHADQIIQWVKTRAKALRNESPVPHSVRLDMASRERGYQNYKTLLAALDAKAGMSPLEQSLRRRVQAQQLQIETLRALIAELADTELAKIACAGSNAPVEDVLGRLFAAAEAADEIKRRGTDAPPADGTDSQMLTPRQMKMLKIAAELPEKQGFAPYRNQLGHSSVFRSLVDAGLLERIDGSMQYRVTPAGEQALASNEQVQPRAERSEAK